MKMIDDWKAALGHYSTKALALAAMLQAGWAQLDPATKALLPPSVAQVVAYLTLVVLVGGLVGKFLDQTPKDPQ